MLLFHHPGLEGLVAGDPHAEVHLFAIRAQRIDVSRHSVEVIAIAELVELEVSVLAVGVTLYALQTAEQQRLAHHAQVLRKRVHDLHTTVEIAGILVVSDLGEGVVENLVEPLCCELLADARLQTLRVGFDTVAEVRIELIGELDIVVAVYTQNIFDHIALALHINAVARYAERPAIATFGDDIDLQGTEDRLDGIFAQLLADELITALDAELHAERRHERSIAEGFGFAVLHIQRQTDRASGNLAHECRAAA